MYLADTDLYARARQDTVTDWITDSAEGPDPDILDQAITWAQTEVDQALLNLYADYLPFTTEMLPESVKNICIDFAVYWLATRAQASAETYVINYKDARARLLRIADGKEPLITPDGETIAASDTLAPEEIDGYAYATTEDVTPIFTRDDTFVASLMQY